MVIQKRLDVMLQATYAARLATCRVQIHADGKLVLYTSTSTDPHKHLNKSKRQNGPM
jgi:hypothetical protein